MTDKLTIRHEFQALRAIGEFVYVPLELWLPDDEAVAYAWLGRLGRLIVGKRRRRLHGGLAPARFHGLLPRSTLGHRREAVRWARSLPELSPTQLWYSIRLGLDFGPLAIRTEFKPHHTLDLTFAFAEQGSHRALALGQRVLFLSENMVEHKWLRVLEQSRGIAAHVIDALLPVYETLGIYTVRITAGLSAGGAVWAKFGFVPDPADWQVVASNVKENIGDLLAHRNNLPTAVRAACETALWCVAQSDPKYLWVISDLGQMPLDGVRLGSYLLRNVRWKGSLSFADDEAVNRLRDRFKAGGVRLTALDSLSAAASRRPGND